MSRTSASALWAVGHERQRVRELRLRGANEGEVLRQRDHSVDPRDPHGGELEVRLLGNGIPARQRQLVGRPRTARIVPAAVMKRDEHMTVEDAAHAGDSDAASARHGLDHVSVADAVPFRVRRRHLNEDVGRCRVQRLGARRFRSRVPVIDHAPGREPERIPCVRLLDRGHVLGGLDDGPPARVPRAVFLTRDLCARHEVVAVELAVLRFRPKDAVRVQPFGAVGMLGVAGPRDPGAGAQLLVREARESHGRPRVHPFQCSKADSGPVQALRPQPPVIDAVDFASAHPYDASVAHADVDATARGA